MFVDTHCHVFKKYYNNIDEVIKKVENNILIISGTNINTNKEVIKLCNSYKNVYGTLGFHPNDLDSFDMSNLEFINNNINNDKIVAIGEIGLDYYRDSSNKEFQKALFLKQLDLAIKHKKSVVVHSRDALEDTYNILKQEKYRKLKIVLHCYSYDYEAANKFVELGIMLGINGIITFKNSTEIRDVVKKIKLQHLLLETDSPYLTPVPHRGKKNEPKNIKYIANEIALIKNICVDKVYEQTTKNALHQFDLK